MKSAGIGDCPTTECGQTGERAFEAAKAFRPDVVVLDIGLPGMDGYEVARRIRAESWGEEMILIAQTGWGQKTYSKRAKQAGFDHTRTKPVALEDIEKLL